MYQVSRLRSSRDTGHLTPDTEKGQALLLVLLSMAVVLTVVLSIVSRSIVDVSVTSKEEEALRAFSAAEAGVEKALITGADISGASGDLASFDARVTGTAEYTTQFVSPVSLISGESAVVWFVNHINSETDESLDLGCNAAAGKPCFTGSKIDICWGSPQTGRTSDTTPALEVKVFYDSTPGGDYAGVKVARLTVDPYENRRQAGVSGAPANNFSQIDSENCGIAGETFQFKKAIDFALLGIPQSVYDTENGLQFARVRMLYNTDTAHEFGVIASSTFPPQGLKIESTGISGTSNRKVEVFQSYGEPPPIFDATLYSPSGIQKN